MSELYDVIFNGPEDHSESVKPRIAKLFHLDDQKLEAMFAQKGGVVIKNGITLDVAKKYHSAISAAGGRCSYKPSQNPQAKLELVPMKRGATEKLFECPACDYSEILEAGKPTPEMCPQCGVSPAKYKKVKSQKDERDKIRKHLLAIHQNRTETDDKERKRVAAEERRKQLEEEISRELGLPKYLTTRLGIFSSAAFVLVAGVSVGVGGTVAYGNIMENGVTTADAPNQSIDAQNIATKGTSGSQMALVDPASNELNGGATPSQEAMMQVAALTGNISIPSGTPASTSQFSSTSQLPVSASMSNINLTGYGTIAEKQTSWNNEMIASASQTVTASNILISSSQPVIILEDDPDWDLTLIKTARHYLKSGKLDESFSIASQVLERTQQLDLLSEIATAYAVKGKHDTVRNKIGSLQSKESDSQPNYLQSLIFSRLAMKMVETKDSLIARQFLLEAEASAKMLPSREQAVATGFIAASQARYAAKAVTTERFRKANALLNSVANITERLMGYVELAPAYAQSGDRIGALAILQRVLQASNKILDDADKSAMFARIVPILADIDSTDSSLKVARQIESASLRDKTLFQLMSSQIIANELYGAMAAADQLTSTAYKAKAFALLARFQTNSTLRPLAKENFGRALNFAGALKSPTVQAVALSEIARYQLTGGDNKEAVNLMNRSLTVVKSIPKRQNQDLAYAAIAKNQARAARFSQSKRTADLISDNIVADDVYREIRNAGEMLTALKF